ncbi:GIY-YIG nuclease family protein [Microbacteriaceae bacterium 4G12]
MEKNKHFFYVVQCCDGSYYAGYTNHLERRIETHNKGKGARYTRSHRPVTLVYYEEFSCKSDALKAEYRFKQLDRKKKEEYMQKER